MEKEQKESIWNRIKHSIDNIMTRFSKKGEQTIEVKIPKGFMNCSVSTCNFFLANTNSSANWDTLEFPLPKPSYKWKIKSYKGDIDNPEERWVVLVDRA